MRTVRSASTTSVASSVFDEPCEPPSPTCPLFHLLLTFYLLPSTFYLLPGPWHAFGSTLQRILQNAQNAALSRPHAYGSRRLDYDAANTAAANHGHWADSGLCGSRDACA